MPARQARPRATPRSLRSSTRKLCGQAQRSHAVSARFFDRINRIWRIKKYLVNPVNPVFFLPVLDIRLIREQPDFVKSRLATRGGDDQLKIDELLALDRAERLEI